MMNRRNWERFGDGLAVVMAILVASVIVALAETANDLPPADTPRPVKIELKRSRSAHLIAIPGPISRDGGASDALNRLAAEENCLAQVIYFEARGENETGRRAVAEVILHRLAEGGHGKTICNVVYEGVGQTFCQFTFACDGSLQRPMISEAWREAQVLAARLLAGEVPADATYGATYYHAISVHPTWAPKKLRVMQIGHHVFYRDQAAGIGAVFRGSMQ